jgi:hypothetical protein
MPELDESTPSLHMVQPDDADSLLSPQSALTDDPPSSNQSPQVSFPHSMTTRSHHGIVKPNPKYALSTTYSSSVPREPRSVQAALAHPGWRAAMNEELTALHQNQTWILVPRTSDMHVIGSKWVLKTKLKPDGSLDRLKARVVAKGFHQIDGIDFTETFSPVVKPSTIRMVITVALVQQWSIRQLDVKNAFLYGFLSEDLFMEQPPEMSDSQYPTHVCKLQRALYGLKQAPRAWFDRFSTFLLKYGFFCSLADPSLFISDADHGSLILLLYVDDILLTGSNATLVTEFIQLLSGEFAMKDLGHVHHFLGIEISHTSDGLYLSQSHYALVVTQFWIHQDFLECYFISIIIYKNPKKLRKSLKFKNIFFSSQPHLSIKTESTGSIRVKPCRPG